MTSTFERVNASAKITAPIHPLEPLTAEEVRQAVTTVRQERSLGDRVRFMSVIDTRAAERLCSRLPSWRFYRTSSFRGSAR